MDEGAGGIITRLGDGWVRKTQKRQARKSKRNPIEIQMMLQAWCVENLTPEKGYPHLFSPEVRPSKEPHSYEMRLVNTADDPWFLTSFSDDFKGEMERFSNAFTEGTGYRLHDIELYLQEDGRVAILDFDQCVKGGGKI